MTTKAGVWIDHKQAVVVLVTDSGPEIKKIAFDIGQPVRTKNSARSKNDFIAEDTLERRVGNDRKDYYDDVIASFSGASEILVFGPGEAKGEFHKQIKSKKQLRGMAIELETTDKMTDGQIAAKVQQHFATGSAKQTGAPKLAAKKRAKPTAGKRRKKSS